MTIAALFLAVLAFLLVLTWLRARRHVARAEQAYPPEGRILVVNGQRVHAVVTGAGPDLVLIHGASGSSRDFTHGLAQKLAVDYRVIVFDRPGLGYSGPIGKNGATITEQAALLMQAALQLGATRPIVLGQSYGGAVALAWAVNHPHHIAALVPLSAASNPWDTPLDLYYRITSSPLSGPLACQILAAWVTDNMIGAALEGVFAPQQPPEGYIAHFGPRLTLRPATLRENALQRANLKHEITAIYRQYGQIAVPAEILHGTADTTVLIDIHSEKLAQQIPGAVLTRLPGIGHMPQHVAQPEVIAAIHRAARRAGLR